MRVDIRLGVIEMSVETIALLSGLVGTVIGALASIGTIWVQQHFQSRQERAKLIVEAAIHEYRSSAEYAKFMAEKNPGMKLVLDDLGHYVVLYSLLIQQLERPEKITTESWGAAYARAKELADAADKYARAQKV